MNRTCEDCEEAYDDLDHSTICPHEWFPDIKTEPWCSFRDTMFALMENQDRQAQANNAQDWDRLATLAAEEIDLQERFKELDDECSVIRAFMTGEKGVTAPPSSL